jgi:phosphotransferase system HPr (HPr) family protein
MNGPSLTRRVTVVNPQGLHARPADMFVRQAIRYQSIIEVTKDGETVDGKSILNMLALAAEQGTELEIGACGPDAQLALEALVALVESGFSEGTESDRSADEPRETHESR